MSHVASSCCFDNDEAVVPGGKVACESNESPLVLEADPGDDVQLDGSGGAQLVAISSKA